MSFLLKLNFVLVVIFCHIKPWAAQTSKYCNPNLCNGAKHIACNNTGALASTCAADAKLMTMTAKIRRAILDKHNKLRNRVAQGKLKGFKSALRMATMTWNPELAKLAALNVKQCSMQHDQCHSTSAYKNSGQNLAFSGWSGTTKKVQTVALEHVQMWFDENKDASMSVINELEGGANFGKYGHFTEMVQEKNCQVGCAILRQTKSDFENQYMACNYAFTNVVGMPVYRRGKTASKCTTGKNKKFPGLCSKKEKYNVNSMSY